MNCQECRGACCESILFPLEPVARRWLQLHTGLRVISTSQVEVESRCSKLTNEGRCGIYDERPIVCALYEAGGKGCLETVKRRRTPEDYQRIRGPEDPETIHG